MDMIEERKRNEKRLAKEQRKRKRRAQAIKEARYGALCFLLFGSTLVTIVYLLNGFGRMPAIYAYAAVGAVAGGFLVMAIVMAYFPGPRVKGRNCNCDGGGGDMAPPQFIYLHHHD